MGSLTVSSKGQVSIPKALREQLHIEQGSKLLIELDRDRIILSKAPDWRELRGIAAGTNLLANHAAEKAWERKHDRRRP